MGRKRIALIAGTAVMVAGLLGAGGAPAQVAAPHLCPNSSATPGSVPPATLAQAATCLINVVRTDAGLQVVRVSPRLVTAESGHVSDMLQNRFLGHRGSDGRLPAARAQAAGYMRRHRAFVVGEVLAYGQSTAGTPLSIVNAWLASPTHRRVLLYPSLREIGLVVAPGGPVGAPGTALDPSMATYGATFGVVRKRR